MRVGIIQSNYIPWRGYFDFIDSVDLFIFHDDIQYTKQDWRNRNKIKSENGSKWLTVPVHYKNSSQLINDTYIDNADNWQIKHLRSIQHAYMKTPYYNDFINSYKGIISSGIQTISELNQKLIKWIMDILGITTKLYCSSDFELSGKSTERLINLLKLTEATTYLSGPSAANYLDYNLFRKAGINLEFKSYDYTSYPQMYGPFVPDVTVLDLLFNTGPKAREYLKSRTPDRLVMDCRDKSHILVNGR